MRKKLIAAIIAILILIAAAVAVIVYMESKPGEISDPENAVTETGDPAETTEETVGLSLPTEDPDDVTPEDSFGEEDEVPPATVGGGNSGETEDPDANETPEDIF